MVTSPQIPSPCPHECKYEVLNILLDARGTTILSRMRLGCRMEGAGSSGLRCPCERRPPLTILNSINYYQTQHVWEQISIGLYGFLGRGSF